MHTLIKIMFFYISFSLEIDLFHYLMLFGW